VGRRLVAVVLIGIQGAVQVGIFPEKEVERRTINEPQLVDRFERRPLLSRGGLSVE